MSFQLIESDHMPEHVYCPHCQHAIINNDEVQYIQPCAHTLFIAMDLSFEFVSDVFEDSLPLSIDEIHGNDENLNIFTEITRSNYPDFVIYKFSLGLHDLSRYVGVAAA
ncbi:hypothetical protein [Acinetobacter larvae]|uniref:Uncharacterized protein n=1 Tax=Acinetobacter larvae TaxID=1789224 RepID=A0A1B2M477_9GAMM|nr:hypothetical protein [Acinetobacter larvae]AOA59969.1 hypothetical protein BFG52_10585 [Acinetobacter larvae]